MSTIRFMYQNLLDTLGIITCSTENAGFPVANLKNRWPTMHWRTTAKTDPQRAIIDLGSAQGVQAVCAKYSNYSGAAVLTLYGHDGNSWPGDGDSLVVAAGANVMCNFFSATKTWEWWCWNVDDHLNSASYLALGRLFIGGYFEPSVNFIDAFGIGDRDPSLSFSSEGGQLSSIQKTKYGLHTYTFKGITLADVNYFRAMFAARGNFRDMWVCEDPSTPASTTYYVRISKFGDFTHVSGTELYEFAIEFEDLR